MSASKIATLLVGLILTATAISQERETPASDEKPAAPAEEQAPASTTDEDADAAEPPEGGQTVLIFDPSEEVSEDLSVSFPTDI